MLNDDMVCQVISHQMFCSRDLLQHGILTPGFSRQRSEYRRDHRAVSSTDQRRCSGCNRLWRGVVQIALCGDSDRDQRMRYKLDENFGRRTQELFRVQRHPISGYCHLAAGKIERKTLTAVRKLNQEYKRRRMSSRVGSHRRLAIRLIPSSCMAP